MSIALTMIGTEKKRKKLQCHLIRRWFFEKTRVRYFLDFTLQTP